MRLGCISCIALLSSCAAQSSERQRLIDTIETHVQLPPGSMPIEEYSRNYAFLPDQKVIAIFVVPHQVTPIDGPEDCETLTAIGEDGEIESRPCSADEIAELNEMDEQMAASSGVAGTSRWLDDYRNLPRILDGGCAQIEIIFDPQSDRFTRLECNGTV